MNSYERVMKRLLGEETDRIPNLNIVMQFAARHIGAPYGKYCTDYRLLTEGNLRCCEDFGINAVSAISDPCREAEGFGAKVHIGEDSVPEIRGTLVNGAEDVKKLKVRSSGSVPRMEDRIRAVELYARQVKGVYPIIGWVEGPFAEAADLRGVNNILMDIALESDIVEDIMAVTLEQAVSFAKEQIAAGADIIGVGDAVASLVGPKLYQKTVLPYEAELLRRIREAGAKTKLHICGNIGPYLEILPVAHCDILDLDWMVDIGKAVKLHGEKVSLCGNINPVAVLEASEAGVAEQVQELMLTGSARYIFAAGCEIPRDTPEENMAVIARTLENT
jgi:MtaA/CmuA family methyltransferase